MKAIADIAGLDTRILTFTTPFEDFFRLDSDEWNSNNAAVDATLAGGVFDLTAATDNAFADVKRAYEMFLLADGKPFEMVARVKFSEAGGAGTTNLFVGFSDQAGADAQLADNGAGVPADWHGAGFLALDGGANLRCVTQKGTLQAQDDELIATNRNNFTGDTFLASSAAWRLFKVQFVHLGINDFHVHFWIDHQHVCTHRLQTASAEPVGELIGIKNGDATSEAAQVDFVSAYGTR